MHFRYRARAKTGKIIKGTIEAGTEKDAIRRLRDEQLLVTHLEPLAQSLTFHVPFFGVSLHDQILFTQELSLMIQAGIPLARALHDLGDQTANRRLATTIKQVALDLRGGISFSDALAKHPLIFSPLMVAVVRSGEASGKLTQVLERLTVQMEKDSDLRGKIKSALLYPLILTIAIIAVLGLVVMYVIPQLKAIFADVGVELPWITRALLQTTDFIEQFGLYLVLGLVALSLGILALLREPGISYQFDRWKIHMPIFGTLSRKVAIARMATTAATLLEAGVPLLSVLLISEAVIGNRYYQKELSRISQAVETGTALSAAIRSGHVFPPIVPNLIAVGEESGSLDQTFQAIATFYDREVEATTRNLTTLLEPLLMLVMGVGIGIVVAAVVIPIYRLVQVV